MPRGARRQGSKTGKRSLAPAGEGERLELAELVSDPRQIRRHTEKNLAMIGDGLRAVGAARSIVLDESNAILAGNGTIEAAAKLGFAKVRVIEADGTEIIAVRRRGLTEKQKVELALYDNRSSDFAEYDGEALARITDLVGLDAELFFSGAERAALLGLEPGASGSLADRFGVPPFSVLDARQGYWQERKAAWLALGVESELGRDPGVWVESAETGSPLARREKIRASGAERINRNLQQSHPASTANMDFYAKKRALEKARGEKLSTKAARELLAARMPIADHRAAHKAAAKKAAR